ncbi:hypothetical protein, partial [Streptomyces albogriseolus]|uniref:hypothetical protein n=1 Tax=Streptomyces albogriseolus TaxID=1887 RepID=UPI003460FA59
VVGNTLVYRDYGHLADAYVEALTPVVEERLLRRSTAPLGSPTPRVYPSPPPCSPSCAGARSEAGEWKGARSPADLCC